MQIYMWLLCKEMFLMSCNEAPIVSVLGVMGLSYELFMRTVADGKKPLSV